MATELRIRRDSNTNLMATTPADGEVGYDQTNKRLIVGDGAKAGGTPHASCPDLQGQSFIAATAGGTANALTLTLSTQFIPAAYVNLQKFAFKAASDNTGAATININSLGAKNIKKIVGGVKTALSAGDIATGIIYEIAYDGTEFQIVSSASGIAADSITSNELAAGAVHQSEISTASGDVSTGTSHAVLVLPGGAYGFYPRLRISSALTTRANVGIIYNQWVFSSPSTLIDATTASIPSSASSNTTLITINRYSGATTVYANQTYVSASPPYDLGDGDILMFAYALMNPDGTIAATYAAQDPPWAYNGPTNIAPDGVINGQAIKRVMVTRQHANGDEASIRTAALDIIAKRIPITPADDLVEVILPLDQAWKNADMTLIPHPFASAEPGQTVVLLDTQSQIFARAIDMQRAGHVVSELMNEWMIIDNTELRNRRTPPGVMPVNFRWRNTRRV